LYQNELKLMRQAIKNKKMTTFIGKRLENSIYKKLYQEIVNNSRKHQKDLNSFY
ncbi:unnamed protein product, partial [marine sediment metagenome]